MVKKQGGGRRYRAAAANAQTALKERAAAQQPARGPTPPKHVQRKIARKVGFLEKVAASSRQLAVHAGVSKKTGRAKRGSTALNTLNSLAEALDELQQDAQQRRHSGLPGGAESSATAADSGAFGQGVKSARARAAVQATELPRLQQVLHHPVFKGNPIAAITNHLTNTLPPELRQLPGDKRSKQTSSRAEIKRAARQRKRLHGISGQKDEMMMVSDGT